MGGRHGLRLAAPQSVQQKTEAVLVLTCSCRLCWVLRGPLDALSCRRWIRVRRWFSGHWEAIAAAVI